MLSFAVFRLKHPLCAIILFWSHNNVIYAVSAPLSRVYPRLVQRLCFCFSRFVIVVMCCDSVDLSINQFSMFHLWVSGWVSFIVYKSQFDSESVIFGSVNFMCFPFFPFVLSMHSCLVFFYSLLLSMFLDVFCLCDPLNWWNMEHIFLLKDN